MWEKLLTSNMSITFTLENTLIRGGVVLKLLTSNMSISSLSHTHTPTRNIRVQYCIHTHEQIRIRSHNIVYIHMNKYAPNAWTNRHQRVSTCAYVMASCVHTYVPFKPTLIPLKLTFYNLKCPDFMRSHHVFLFSFLYPVFIHAHLFLSPFYGLFAVQ
jgi:hypothetical protein